MQKEFTRVVTGVAKGICTGACRVALLLLYCIVFGWVLATALMCPNEYYNWLTVGLAGLGPSRK